MLTINNITYFDKIKHAFYTGLILISPISFCRAIVPSCFRAFVPSRLRAIVLSCYRAFVPSCLRVSRSILIHGNVKETVPIFLACRCLICH